MSDTEHALGLILRPGQARVYFASVDRREDEKLVAPDDRGGTAVALDRCLPLDVVGWAPLEGGLGCGGDAVGIRSTPVMPVVRLGLFKGGNLRGDRGKREAEHYGEEGMVRFHYSFKSQFQFAGAAGEGFSLKAHLVQHVKEEVA